MFNLQLSLDMNTSGFFYVFLEKCDYVNNLYMLYICFITQESCIKYFIWNIFAHFVNTTYLNIYIFRYFELVELLSSSFSLLRILIKPLT